jgi:methyltransferase-like protein
VIDDTNFDIQDKKLTIKQSLGTGSGTYNNPNNKIIAVIDYEHFLNQQPNDVIKALGLKKCDFIVYHLDGNTFFILNELSLSSSSKNKINDARKQLHNALLHLSRTHSIKSFIDSFVEKLCVFSNKTKTIETPEDIAGAFDIIRSYLPEPIVHSFQPIEKLNFKLVETAIIDV